MTLIAALVDDQGIIHMAGDRRASNNCGDRLTEAEPKITCWVDKETKERMLIGCSGLSMVTKVCGTLFGPPPLPSKETDLGRWLLGTLRPQLLQKLTESELLQPDKETGARVFPGVILIGMRSQLITIFGRVEPRISNLPYEAIGIADDCGMGALCILTDEGRHRLSTEASKKALLQTMRTGTFHKQSVGPPYDYLTSAGETEEWPG